MNDVDKEEINKTKFRNSLTEKRYTNVQEKKEEHEKNRNVEMIRREKIENEGWNGYEKDKKQEKEEQWGGGRGGK